jgi:hypothetical protein
MRAAIEDGLQRAWTQKLIRPLEEALGTSCPGTMSSMNSMHNLVGGATVTGNDLPRANIANRIFTTSRCLPLPMCVPAGPRSTEGATRSSEYAHHRRSAQHFHLKPMSPDALRPDRTRLPAFIHEADLAPDLVRRSLTPISRLERIWTGLQN